MSYGTPTQTIEINGISLQRVPFQGIKPGDMLYKIENNLPELIGLIVETERQEFNWDNTQTMRVRLESGVYLTRRNCNNKRLWKQV